ncbi:MAG: sulfotransferase [Pseudomonadales bacterium]
MSNDIYIDDIAEPRHSDLQKMALEYGETLETVLDREDILNEAKETTGLNDFGSLDFIERLDLLCSEWGDDEGLSGIGRLSLRNKLVLFACSRLLIEDKIKQHPEILDEKIDRPIIVAGLPRSGTTHLLNLMAADSRLRSLPLWESYEPVSMTGEAMLDDGTDPRYKRCADSWEMMQQMTPHLAAMHPMDPDHIHEELELMGPDFASYNFEWLCTSPRWRDDYYSKDQTPHYEYMKKVLKLLQWQDRQAGKAKSRWVLKCPQHLEQLTVLQTVFPDATIAVTHRDPVSVIQSSVTMLGYGQRMSRKQVQTQGLVDYWADRIEHLLQACVRDRGKLSDAQSIDVPFDVFMADDLAMVDKIYAKADLDMNEKAKAELQTFIDDHPRGKHGRMIYNLQEQFGVSREQLAERFGFYYQQFPVKRESK